MDASGLASRERERAALGSLKAVLVNDQHGTSQHTRVGLESLQSVPTNRHEEVEERIEET